MKESMMNEKMHILKQYYAVYRILETAKKQVLELAHLYDEYDGERDLERDQLEKALLKNLDAAIDTMPSTPATLQACEEQMLSILECTIGGKPAILHGWN